MDSFFSYTVLGFVQGLTEFLPVSSSGHLVVAHQLLGITENGLAVDAVLQLATALAILVYFWKDILNLFYTGLYLVLGKPVRKEDSALLVALVVGTVPAIILGLFLEQTMETLFRNSHLVAYALLAGSAVMLVAEYLNVRPTRSNIGKEGGMEGITWGKGLVIGFFQALALIPGMSRSGMTIAGGMFLGFSRESAARFGFLLAVPIILGSGLKKLLELWGGGELVSIGAPLLWGSAVAFFSGLLAIYMLLAFVRRQPLYVFIAYRVLLAGIILFFL